MQVRLPVSSGFVIEAGGVRFVHVVRAFRGTGLQSRIRFSPGY